MSAPWILACLIAIRSSGDEPLSAIMIRGILAENFATSLNAIAVSLIESSIS